MGTRSWHIRLREWFPPNDPIATIVAILCILREDYFLDLNGMIKGGVNLFEDDSAEKGFPELDQNSSEWRRLYFFRNSLRTLREIRKAVERLHQEKTCKEALRNEPESVKNAFQKLRDEMNTGPDLVKDLRDKIGGHVLYPAVQKALDKMDHGRRGLMQVGERRGKIHYKFTGELVLAMMLPDIAPEGQIQKLDGILSTTAKLVLVMSTIDDVVAAYAESRNLRW